MSQICLIDCFDSPLNAIISALNQMDVPWLNNNYYVPDDMDYLFNHSANKLISRMVDNLLDNNCKLTSTAIALLAQVIFKLYSRKWQKLYATFELTYNPTNNYDMTERMTNDRTDHVYDSSTTRTNDLTQSKTGDDTITHDTQNQRVPDLETVRASEIQGFNSSDYSPSNRETVNETGSDTITNTGTDTTAYDTTLTDTGTVTDERLGTDSDIRNYLLTRSGNIGVTTTQQMIEQERRMWEYDFIEIVYSDIDRVLTIPYFKCGE